ncbi:hypothetical protein LDENG_00056270 [Lucifuga dentata]|nr:hypothetical protein LDENG_00056270 [Lucifuga dentata]
MITHLQKRDQELYSTLNLSSGPPAQPAALSQQEQTWSSVLIPCTDDYKRDKLKDNSIYPVDGSSPRLALVITNTDFKNVNLNRRGGEKDEQNMEELLTALRYEVVKHRNLTGKEIDKAIIEFSKNQRLKQTDSVFVVIMSHGKMGVVFGIDWTEEKPDEFPIDNVYKHLGTENCPALLDKPKVIIIQACRGEKDGSVLVSDGPGVIVKITPDSTCGAESQRGPSLSAGEENMEDDAWKRKHKEKDFVCLLSCTPDTLSYRQPERGSFLIQYIVEVFNTCSHEDDIEELFRKVMQRFEDFPSYSKRQMPTKDRCTLTRRFFLFPGH